MNSIGSGWVVSSEKRGIEVDSGNQDGTMEKERSLEVGGGCEGFAFYAYQSQGPREVQRN